MIEIYYARTHASKMDYLAEPPRRLLCWTVCAYKRPDLDDEYYHNYMSQVHGPLVKDLLVKYGFVKWSMVSFGNVPSSFDFQSSLGIQKPSLLAR